MELIASRTVSRRDFKKHRLLRVDDPRSGKFGEERTVDYGQKFTFEKVSSTPFFEECGRARRRQGTLPVRSEDVMM